MCILLFSVLSGIYKVHHISNFSLHVLEETKTNICQSNTPPPLLEPESRSPKHDGLLRNRRPRLPKLLHLQTISRRCRGSSLTAQLPLNHPRWPRLGRSSRLPHRPPLPQAHPRYLHNLHALHTTPTDLHPRYRPPELQVPNPSCLWRSRESHYRVDEA